MTFEVRPISQAELDTAGPSAADSGLGALRTERGNLPLDRLAVQARISGLVARVQVTAEFVNVHDSTLEATYVFPLPDRAAVTGMRMTAAGRVVDAQLQERAAAREAYDRAVQAGQRASIAEQERPDVFTMRVGNILPGERVAVELRLVGQLPFEDGVATFRFPLVVAPRYVPGVPLPGPSVGTGQVPDTDAVPDASRITPPVLLPGFPNPLRLSIDVDLDPAGLTLGEVRSSLHALVREGGHLSIEPGERADRDFILRLAYADADCSAVVVPDPNGERAAGSSDGAGTGGGTYQLTVLPPPRAGDARPKDVVLLLDRSGSMGGWKMVAARRAAARIVDTLTRADRFAVLTFDTQVEHPAGLGQGLAQASDRHRFTAVEHLAAATARGGTELLAPLHTGLGLLAEHSGPEVRDRVLVLVTDGQVGNEDQILADAARLVGTTRIHTVGIDQAVNAGFLARLAALAAGRCELVESEDRLDEAMEHIHRRIAAPVVSDLTVTADGLTLLEETRCPQRLTAVYPGVPLVVTGRYTGAAAGSFTITGSTPDGGQYLRAVQVQERHEPAVTAQWARARLRDLEDRYVAGKTALEPEIVATSLRFGVLCRFTAYVAVDSRIVTDGGPARQVTQPVEFPAGWHLLTPPVAMPAGPAMRVERRGAAVPASGQAPPPPRLAQRLPQARRDAAPMLAGGRPAANGEGSATDAALGQGRGDPLRAIMEVEVRRLREADGQPAHTRRQLLADLATRLHGLLADRTDPVIEPLRALLARLTSAALDTDDLDDLWLATRKALDDFLRHTPADTSRTTFWKR
jgi:Ca-activated chloride channel family protein